MKDQNFSQFCFSSPEIIGVKACNRRTDRQTNSLTEYIGVCGFFLSVKFATSLLALLTGELLVLVGMLKIVRKLLKNAARVDRD